MLVKYSYAPPVTLYEPGAYGRTLDKYLKGFRFHFDKYDKTMYTENRVYSQEYAYGG